MLIRPWHSPMDLHLVLLPFAVVSQSRANDLAAAAERGSAREVESMLQLPQDPDLPGLNGCTALRRASRAGRVEIAACFWRQVPTWTWQASTAVRL